MMVVLSAGMLHWPPLLVALTLAMRSGVKLLPVMSESTFSFPSANFILEFENTGEPLGRSTDDVERRLNGYLCGQDGGEAIRIRIREVSFALKTLFQQCAPPFEVNYRSERIIEAQTIDIIRKLREIHKLSPTVGLPGHWSALQRSFSGSSSSLSPKRVKLHKVCFSSSKGSLALRKSHSSSKADRS